MERVSDRELKKLLKILGSKEIKRLFIYNKLNLSQKQLDYVINCEDAERDNDKNSKSDRDSIKRIK